MNTQKKSHAKWPAKRLVSLLLALVLLVGLCGCSEEDLRNVLTSMLPDAASEDTPAAGATPAPTPTQSDAATPTPDADPTPEATVINGDDGDGDDDFIPPPEKWNDAEEARSSLFNAGCFVQGDMSFYMDGPGHSGLYRLPIFEDGTESLGYFPYGVGNMVKYYELLNHDYNSYMYFNAYLYDSDPGRLYRIREGDAEPEELLSSAAEVFVLMDDAIFYKNPYVPDIYEDDENTKLYRAPLNDLSAAEVVFQSDAAILGLCEDGRSIYLSLYGDNGTEIIQLDPETLTTKPLLSLPKHWVQRIMVIYDRLFIRAYADDSDDYSAHYFLYNINSSKITELEDAIAVASNDLYTYILKAFPGDTSGRLMLYGEYLDNLDRSGQTFSLLCDLSAMVPSDIPVGASYMHQFGGTLYLYFTGYSDDQDDWFHDDPALAKIIRLSLFDGEATDISHQFPKE